MHRYQNDSSGHSRGAQQSALICVTRALSAARGICHGTHVPRKRVVPSPANQLSSHPAVPAFYKSQPPILYRLEISFEM